MEFIVGLFLFSLDNKLKLELVKARTHAMYGNPTYGPTFAGNHDLYICDNCFFANSSYNNVGYSYKLPANAQADTVLAGEKQFYVEEYEVYGVQIDVLSYFEDSVILKTCPNAAYLNEIIPFQFTSVKKLLKASDFGFQSAEFHNKCDNLGPTLILIKTKNTRYFGAFCTVSWNKTINNYQNAEGSFLFSLDNQAKLEVFQNQGNTMYCNNDYGPTFGGGHDLQIASDCSNKNGSYSIIGSTYKLPAGATANTFFAGAQNFAVEEYEVYSLTY